MDTSYLAQQVNTIISQLHGLFDEIGVPNHDRETREAEVCPLSRCCRRVNTNIDNSSLQLYQMP